MESQGYRATNEGGGGAAAYPGAGGSSSSPAAATGQNDPERVRNEARRGAQMAKDEVKGAAQQATQHAGEFGRQVKDSARAAADQTKRKASEYAQQARDRGMEMLDEQRHQAASQLQTVGEAVHRAADKFREDRDENIAGYVDAMADEVDRCAHYLEERDLRSLVRDTQQFARRNPEWFLGGMFFAGLALSRFLKASRPDDRQYEQRFSSADTSGGGGGGAWGREGGMGATGASASAIEARGDSERPAATMPSSTMAPGGAGAGAIGGPAIVTPTDTTGSSSTLPLADSGTSMPGDNGPACGPTV